jgi:hypothetical protein
LSSQYYVVISPLGVALAISALILLPWIGAWRNGKNGLAWMVGLEFLCIIAMNVWVRLKSYQVSNLASDMAALVVRVSVIQLVIIAVSAGIALAFLRPR